MDKQKLLNQLIDHLKREQKTLVDASLDAKEAATNEESKAENKYDTRGLEASYLAGAQAKRAKEVAEAITIFEHLKVEDFSSGRPLAATAVVELEVDGEETRWFFLVPKEGGTAVEDNGQRVTSLSLDSPLGKNLLGAKVGHVFEVTISGQIREYEVISAS